MDVSSPNREPPDPAPLWDGPLEEASLAFVDLEMTGLDAAKHRVIEICIERVVGDQLVDRLETYVRPVPWSDEVGNQKIHGIDATALREAPTFGDLVSRILQLLDGAAMVAHGAKWDAAFLMSEMSRSHIAWTSDHHIDTLALARRLMKEESYRLAALAKSLSIPNESHHRAGNDVAVTRGLFHHLAGLARTGTRELTLRAVWERCVGRSTTDPAILDAAERALLHGAPTRVCYRASRRAPQDLEFVVTQVRRDLDPPLVLGYLHLTRGRRQLRADRIMSLELVQ
jgi:DNA polymerase-3 subunit epsilon